MMDGFEFEGHFEVGLMLGFSFQFLLPKMVHYNQLEVEGMAKLEVLCLSRGIVIDYAFHIHVALVHAVKGFQLFGQSTFN